MLPVSSILRFPLWLLQIAGDKFGLHAIENGAVKEERPPLSLLRISRNFESIDSQVTDTLEGDGRLPSMEGSGHAFKDKLIGRANASQIWMERDWKHEGIGKTSWSL